MNDQRTSRIVRLACCILCFAPTALYSQQAADPGGGNTHRFSFSAGEQPDFSPPPSSSLDLGELVLSGESTPDHSVMELGQAEGEGEALTRFKLKAGYDFGGALGYGVIGQSRADAPLGFDDGYAYGAGLAIPLSDQFTLSGEVLLREKSGAAGGGAGTEQETLNLRATFRF